MTQQILVIDDDPLVREMIVEILEEEGYEAVASLNFKEALQKARRTPPDLVLIDVVMPEISGFDACRTIKETLKPHPPPVLLMTGTRKLRLHLQRSSHTWISVLLCWVRRNHVQVILQDVQEMKCCSKCRQCKILNGFHPMK